MSDLDHRIRNVLEPILELKDPRERLSAYHDMPYALFRYDPEEEFDLRKQVTLLETRLTQKGNRVKRISLAECLDEAMRSQRPLEEWFTAEREQGVETVVETVHSVLSEYTPQRFIGSPLRRARASATPHPSRGLGCCRGAASSNSAYPSFAPGCASGPRATHHRQAPPATARAFDDIELLTVDGKPVKLGDFAAPVTVIGLWATWCKPCLAELPYLDQLY